MRSPDSDLDAFEAGRAEAAAKVFADHPELLYDHRDRHSWLTGALGDPFADVWFVAENPSLTQVERVAVKSPESQWSQSPGDRLFRSCLVEHGFKDPPPERAGGWRCYISDVVRSAVRAGDWGRLRSAEQKAVVRAWAPVLSWELEQDPPAIVVSVGKNADTFLDLLESERLIPALPHRMQVQHYSYVAMRPDRARQLPPNDPLRVREYRAEFAAVARKLREIRGSG